MYYSTQEHFEQLFEQTPRTYAFCATNPQEMELWRSGLRERLWELTGMGEMRHCPPDPQVLEEVPCEGYTRIKMTIRTESDVTMPFYLLKPDGIPAGGKRGAVIAAHGHSSNGKEAVAGVRSTPEMTATIDHYQYNYGEVLAREGYLVFCPDARGFGERRERYQQGDAPEQYLSSSCDYLHAMAISLGQTVIGMWTWDLMRLADYALSRPDCSGHLASVGLSGGGMQSLWFSALDQRVECAVVSGYFYGYLQSLLINFNCFCNYVPGLWKAADIGEIAALIAPRPLLIETGDADDLNGRDGLKNVAAPLETVKNAMALLGVPQNLSHDIFHGEHRWNGIKAIPWVLSHMPAEETI